MKRIVIVLIVLFLCGIASSLNGTIGIDSGEHKIDGELTLPKPILTVIGINPPTTKIYEIADGLVATDNIVITPHPIEGEYFAVMISKESLQDYNAIEIGKEFLIASFEMAIISKESLEAEEPEFIRNIVLKRNGIFVKCKEYTNEIRCEKK